ncbi:MAG: chromosomal replication initiator protein DnaA [Oscillospiraceae bacterium]
MNSLDEVFGAVKDYCKERVVTATFNLFIDGIEPVSFEGSIATLSVRSEFLKGVVTERYSDLLKEAFKTLLGFDVQIEFVVPAAAAAANPFACAVPDGRNEAVLPGGNYDFTFSNFIVGSSNKFAHAAAQAVAANPSGAYNPLFIYGGSGLGKTHLLNAIMIEIRKNHPEYNIVYVDGERFTNEIITAIHDNTTAQFHNKYRAADVFLVDDIQFIGGKESTQEEFFHTFNTLYNAGKQIVLVSDRPPKEIKSLEERLRTRFEWGLTADIQPPDFETRVAIIRRKANLLNCDIPDDVAEYIANRLKNNIRQLEGAVKKLNAYRMLEGIQPVIGAAQNAIKDILNESQPVPVTIEKIVGEVARTYGVSAADIKGRKRNAAISVARKTSMYVVREITGMSMEDIGNEFGNRDHSTVVYSLNEVARKIETDKRMAETIEDIIKNVRT